MTFFYLMASPNQEKHHGIFIYYLLFVKCNENNVTLLYYLTYINFRKTYIYDGFYEPLNQYTKMLVPTDLNCLNSLELIDFELKFRHLDNKNKK